MKKELYMEVPVLEVLRKLTEPLQTVDGREILNPVPLQEYMDKRPPTLAEQIKRVVRSEKWKEMAERQGFGSFQDEDDFEDENDEEPLSGYEVKEMKEDFRQQTPDPVPNDSSDKGQASQDPPGEKISDEGDPKPSAK